MTGLAPAAVVTAAIVLYGHLLEGGSREVRGWWAREDHSSFGRLTPPRRVLVWLGLGWLVLVVSSIVAGPGAMASTTVATAAWAAGWFRYGRPLLALHRDNNRREAEYLASTDEQGREDWYALTGRRSASDPHRITWRGEPRWDAAAGVAEALGGSLPYGGDR